MNNFRTFNSAVEFYRLTRTLKLSTTLKEQLNRAASSIALNLAEGRGKRTTKDQIHFFHIAFGSVRECQAILMLAELQNHRAATIVDGIAAQLYRLIQKAG